MSKEVKTIFLAILAILGMVIFAWLNNFIFADNFAWLWKIILLIFAYSIGLGFWGLAIYLIEDRWVSHLISLLACLALLFIIPINIYYLIALILLFIYLLFAAERIHKERKSRLKIMLDESTSIPLKNVLTIFCLFVALNFYYSPIYQEVNINIPQNYEDKILSYLVPGFNREITVDDFIYLMMAKQAGIKDPLAREEFIQQKKKEMSVDDFNEYKAIVLKQLGLQDSGLSGEEKIKNISIVEDIYANRITEFLTKYTSSIHLGLTLTIFVLLIWLWKIFYPFVYLVIWLLYKLMLVSGFLQLTKSQVEAEKVEL